MWAALQCMGKRLFHVLEELGLRGRRIWLKVAAGISYSGLIMTSDEPSTWPTCNPINIVDQEHVLIASSKPRTSACA